ncbi:MAG: Crp/Fnr family transcriptional regulator [Cyanobacteria bacterium P01_F01_bin.3]
MYQALLQRLNQLVLLNPQQQRSLCGALKVIEVSKDDVLLERGQVSDHIYFLLDGVVRASCEVEGKDVTRWFSFKGDFASAYFSFVYRQPSEDAILPITDTKVLSLSYSALQDLSKQDTIWIDLNRHLLEFYYTTLQARVMAFQTQSTAERYHSLLQEHPYIEEKVPLGYLASYLGMSQETLSRIRAKRAKKK